MIIARLVADILPCRCTRASRVTEGREVDRTHHTAAGEMQGLPGAKETQHSQGTHDTFAPSF